MTNSTADLIGAAEAAEILHISRRQVNRWAEQGRLRPAGKLPGKTTPWLFDRADVERLRAAIAAKAAG